MKSELGDVVRKGVRVNSVNTLPRFDGGTPLHKFGRMQERGGGAARHITCDI